MRVTIIGTGYVGLTTAVALAYVGHRVTAVDTDHAKIAHLKKGRSPIHEPGVDELLTRLGDRLDFTTDAMPGLEESEVVVFAVGTPSLPDGAADIRAVEAAVQQVAANLRPGQECTLTVKSTVPPGTNRNLAAMTAGGPGWVRHAFCPEFLREGLALNDTFYPDRLVIGTEDPEAAATLSRLYEPFLSQRFTAPDFLPRPAGYKVPLLVITDPQSAEVMKYAANAFLALKISFINEMAGLCERVGADVADVAHGIGLDKRISPHFLHAGLGWGGSCFPKDTAGILAAAREHGYPMPIVQAARDVNARQQENVADRIAALLGPGPDATVAVLGLAFKPDTDDIRESPALRLVRLLRERGLAVRAHDPVAMPRAALALHQMGAETAESPYAAATGADALVLATEWPVYASLDLPRLAALTRRPILLDGRSLFDPAAARAAGFQYMGIGRGRENS